MRKSELTREKQRLLWEVHLSNNITTIPDDTFNGCKKLTSINWPLGIKKIGMQAFYGCESLTETDFSDEMITIDRYAFQNCVELKSIVIPDNVTYIGESVFNGCEALECVELGKNIEKISEKTFYGCISLKSIEFPKKVMSIEDSAFANCTDLKQVFITRKIISIAENAFSYPKKMTMYGPSDCYAQTYAEEKNIKYVIRDIHATSVQLNITNKTSDYFDEFQLTASITPQNFTDAVVWTSSNEDVATVSDNGYVKVHGVGKAAIVVTVGNVKATCMVIVPGNDNSDNNGNQTTEKIKKVSGITLNKTSVMLNRGKKIALKATISPSDASNKKVVWKSGNTKVATVNNSGNVTAKAPGRTKITVTSAENSSYQVSCTVTVPYNIIYKLNKGKNNASNPSTYYGKKITLKNPSRKGYAFAGWYTDAKLKKRIKAIESNAKCDYTLYAKWTKVNVAKVSITSAKNSKSKQILLKYKKISGIKGYEISYSTDKKFKKAVTKKSTAKTSYTVSKLKKGKTYYVRIRAYKVDSTGKKVYGKYSSVKKIKVVK